MIKMHQVSKKFADFRAVDNFTLNVQEKEILGLVGPDGAGKTTVIRLMTGVLEPSSGSVLILNKSNINQIKQYIGYIPQKFSLYQDLTVMENIELLGSLYGVDKKRIGEMAENILSFTGLWQFRQRLSGKLSGGMKQKLALAAGLMHKPKILFLDEPTTGVDPVARREFWQLLYQMNQEGMTIVVSTPYMDEAELCHRIALMNEGRLLSCDTPENLIKEYPYQLLELKVSGTIEPEILQAKQIIDYNYFGDRYHLVVTDAKASMEYITEMLQRCTVEIKLLQPITPSLEDVFIAIGKEG